MLLWIFFVVLVWFFLIISLVSSMPLLDLVKKPIVSFPLRKGAAVTFSFQLLLIVECWYCQQTQASPPNAARQAQNVILPWQVKGFSF